MEVGEGGPVGLKNCSGLSREAGLQRTLQIDTQVSVSEAEILDSSIQFRVFLSR